VPAPHVRRIVTGHDAEGRSIIQSDSPAPTDRFAQVWTTAEFPANNQDATDGGERPVGIALPGGSVFRIGEIAPGANSPMHRTRSIDYGIVLEGELDMELDGGETVHLGPGDVVVQRGTMHAWINNSDRPTRMAWILLDALPVVIDGRTLEPNM